MKNIILILLASFIVISCEDDGGIGGSKPAIPSDHKESQEGIMHKEGYEYPFGLDKTSGEPNCSGARCHGEKLKGGPARFLIDNVVYLGVAPSCYQCHGKIWNSIDSLGFIK